jgi:putative endonuclease
MRGTTPGTIYLIHFDQPIGNPATPYGQARHYLGWACDLPTRIAQHRRAKARAARIMRYLGWRGIGWQVVRTWRGTLADEQRLKRWKNAPCLCPVCRAAQGKAPVTIWLEDTTTMMLPLLIPAPPPAPPPPSGVSIPNPPPPRTPYTPRPRRRLHPHPPP